MATPINMPKLGLTMKRGKVVKWYKGDGERVEKGELLVVVMSKKVTFELEAPASGVVRVLAPAKEERDVAEPIGFILERGESMPEATEKAAEAELGSGTPVDTEKSLAPPPSEIRASPAARRLARELGIDVAAVAEAQGGSPVQESDVRAFQAAQEETEKEEAPALREVRSSPAARRLARELGVDMAEVARRSEGEGPITESDVRHVYEERRAVLATPLARRMVEEEGLELSEIEGSGPAGKIIEADVLQALEIPAGMADTDAGLRTIPLTGMREAIAETMVESLRSTAQLTLTARADVTQLVSLREELRERWGERVTYTDVIVKAVALALREHPRLNSTLAEEEIIFLDEINVGVAVALEDGLIVPVVRGADQKSVPVIHREIRAFAQAARAGSLSVDEVTGGTFTISNLGAYGVESFTPILNEPEVGILGVGQIAREPVFVGEQVVARSRMTLSLTIDHQVVDGAPGAAFLQTMVRLLEQPALIFAGDGGGARGRDG